MDFIHETLVDGGPLQILTVVDNGSRQSPVLEAGFRMSGATVGEARDRVLNGDRGPGRIPITGVGRVDVSPRHPAGFYSAGKTRGNGLQ